MTGQEICLDILRQIGVTGFGAVENDQALNRPGLDDDDLRRAIAAINSALQSIAKYGPQPLKYAERSCLFNNPVTLTVTAIATNGLTATLSAPPPAWVLGCSGLFAGDSDMNRIVDISGSTISLLRAFRGTTGATTVVVYADCALLGSDIRKVLEPVNGSQLVGTITNKRTLHYADLNTFLNFQREISTQASPTNLIGIPTLYHVERRRNGDLFMRVTPLPGSGINVTFQAELRAERVTNSIVNTVGGPDPGYAFTSLPDEDIESILLPIARWRFFTHPSLKNAETRQAVEKEYNEAMLALTNGSVFATNVAANHAEYI